MTKLDSLRISIARYAVLFGNRARKASEAEMRNLTFAMMLLNQAQDVAASSENEAKKLLTIARNIANTGAQDESKRQQPRRVQPDRKKSASGWNNFRLSWNRNPACLSDRLRCDYGWTYWCSG